MSKPNQKNPSGRSQYAEKKRQLFASTHVRHYPAVYACPQCRPSGAPLHKEETEEEEAVNA